MEIVVFGAGSLGSLVGGLLAREHDVTLVGRSAHVEAIRTDGLTLTGEFDEILHPAATIDGTDLNADLALVTVKAFDTEAAADALETGSYDAVCSLQNGLGNEELLAARLECPILAGSATYGAIRREPGVVECTGRGEVVIGAPEGGCSPLADRVGAAFDAAGIETTVATDVPRRRWEKLAVNAGINGVTALARVENGRVLEAPARGIARAAARETARTARAHGVSLSNRAALEAMESVAEATAANTSSTLQDVLAGRRTEVDAINGAVVHRARAAGLEAPTNELLASLLRTWESEHENR